MDINKTTVKMIYDDIIPKLTASKDNWEEYLKFISRIWKHRYDAQILIYAQRPDATFVADINVWNKKFFRNKNKDAKAIKIFDTTVTPVKAKLLYDVSDTNGHEKTYPRTWVLNDEYKELLCRRINEKYKVNNKSLDENIKYLCNQYANIVYKSYISDDNANRQVSILDLEGFELEKKFKLTLAESMIYLISVRCNININISNCFENITDFMSKDIIIKLCSAVSYTSQIILKVIENELTNIIEERKLKNDRDKLQRSGRDVASGDRDGRESTGEGAYREIRTDGNELSEGDESEKIYGTVHEWGADEHNETSQQGSERVTGQVDRPEAEIRSSSKPDGHIRELQTQGHAKERSRRSRTTGNNISVKVEEQAGINDNMELDNEIDSSFIMQKNTINNVEKLNYIYKESDKVQGGLKTKFKYNLEAIKLLKQIEQENHLASSEEQSILAKYSGWGGMPQVFDEKSSSWANEFNELKDVLSEEEYRSARASTPNAHYTPKEVIEGIYSALRNFGFSQGNLLEPSMAVGYFFSLLPEEMKESKLFGVELDSISGRMSRQLYQKAEVLIKGYQETEFENNFFDVAVGNVPFGDYKVHDRDYNKYNFFIHDYFIAKTIDKVRPGGIIAFVTSKGTMDKQDNSVRKYIAERADLIGAIRLPNVTFKEANTDVTSDILFLQKRENINLVMPEWVNIGKNADEVPLNQYYIDNLI